MSPKAVSWEWYLSLSEAATHTREKGDIPRQPQMNYSYSVHETALNLKWPFISFFLSPQLIELRWVFSSCLFPSCSHSRSWFFRIFSLVNYNFLTITGFWWWEGLSNGKWSIVLSTILNCPTHIITHAHRHALCQHERAARNVSRAQLTARVHRHALARARNTRTRAHVSDT